MIKILSSDDQVFEVEENVLFQSTLIKNIVSDLDASDQAIPLQNVTSVILKKIIKYAEHHKDDETVEEDEGTDSTITDEWDIEFMKLDKDVIIEIILAANYLDMKNLLNLGCKTIANMIKGKSVEEIREILDLPEDPVEESDITEIEDKIESVKVEN
jgi:S-phase kinase-associated protein 1